MKYVIGIGVQKAATSWLHSVLSAHPKIDASTPKEVDFFSYYFDRGYGWYEKHFEKTNELRVEISPSYFIDPRAPKRLYSFAPDAKIILLLRDPIERAFSGHLHEVVKGHIDPCRFFEALPSNPMYIEQSLYGKHLAKWLKVFPRSQILILQQEAIKNNPDQSARIVLDFIGLNSLNVPLTTFEKRNVSDQAKLRWLRTVLRFFGGIFRKMGIENVLIALKSVPPLSYILEKNAVDARDIVPPLSLDERDELREYFNADQARLSELLKSKN